MIRPVLFMGDGKKLGATHAVCCEWIAQSRRRGTVAKVSELEEGLARRAAWNSCAGWRAIHEAIGLPVERSSSVGLFDARWLAGHLATLHGYALLVLSGGGIDPPEAASRRGHTVALRSEPGNIQYFDPNIGTLQIDTVREFCGMLAKGPLAPGERYAEFSRMRCELAWV